MHNALYPDLPILHVDDDQGVVTAVERTLRLHNYNNLLSVTDSRQVRPLLEKTDVALILLDISMPHLRGDQLLEELTADFPEVPVVMVTATDAMENVVECMKRGAFDYISKPLETTRLLSAIRVGLEIRELRRENVALRETRRPQVVGPRRPELFQESLASTAVMLNIFRYIEDVAPSSQPVMISGETGVGKELVARSVHRASGRAGAFVAVNVAGLDDNVVADTLFGHVKGAFTGANTARDGQVRRARGGSLFLDEIGDLSDRSQVKLLRLLQEKEYLPLGSDEPLETDARIIVASNRNLEEMVEQGLFRRDLYFRICAHHIEVPPLRQRYDDLRLLVPHFVRKAAREFDRQELLIPEELYTLLGNYSFPGNIRELRAKIYDAVSRQRGRVLGMSSFVRKGKSRPRQQATVFEGNGHELVRFGPELPTVREIRCSLAREALRRSGGNVSLAARLIGITRQSLSQFIRQHQIDAKQGPVRVRQGNA